MKNKKSIIIVVVCILLAVAISAGFGVSTYIKTENENAKNAINAEIDAINKILDDESEEDLDTEALYELLDKRVVTKGKYAIVEDASKKYIKDFYENTLPALDLIDDKKFVNLFTMENMKNDGPDFKKSMSFIKNAKKTVEDCKYSYNKMNSKETILSYVDDKGLNDDQIAFYMSIFDKWFDEKEDKEYYRVVEDIYEYLSLCENAFNFLSEHKDGWEIKNDAIIFESEKDLREYRNIILEFDFD